MAHTPDVCIRGGGIVGRTLALLLARERLRVALVAPASFVSPGHSDVRAYALSATSRQLLETVRVWPDAPAVTPITHMAVRGDAGGEIHFDAGEAGVEALAWMVDVPALEARLAEAVRFQSLIELRESGGEAPLTVVCEGRMSQTRAELGVAFDVQAYPQHAIATRLRTERPHGGVAHQWFTDSEILAFLPLGGAQGQEVAVVWSVPADRVGACRALSSDALAERLGTLSAGVLGALTPIAESASWPLLWGRALRWAGPWPGRPDRQWALAGDAAHAVHPLSGQGLNLGLGDVAALAQAIATRENWRSPSDPKVLRRYERSRQADVLSKGLTTDALQQLFWRPGATWQTLRNTGLRGVDRLAPLKNWLVRQAMGSPPSTA